jgi:hypothetical protein
LNMKTNLENKPNAAYVAIEFAKFVIIAYRFLFLFSTEML